MTVLPPEPRSRKRRRWPWGLGCCVLALGGAAWWWRWELARPWIEPILKQHVAELLGAEIHLSSWSGSLLWDAQISGIRLEPQPGSRLSRPAFIDRIQIVYRPMDALLGVPAIAKITLQGLDLELLPESGASAPVTGQQFSFSDEVRRAIALLGHSERWPDLDLHIVRLVRGPFQLAGLQLALGTPPGRARQLQVSVDSLAAPGLDQPLAEVQLQGSWQGQRLSLGSTEAPGLSLHMGAGRVYLSGSLDPEQLALRLQAEQLLVPLPSRLGVRARLSGFLALEGSPEHPVLRGDIGSETFEYRREFAKSGKSAAPRNANPLENLGLELPLANAGGIALPGLPGAENLRLDISVHTLRPAMIANTFVAGQVEAQLRLHGTLAQPAWSGNAKALSGEVRLLPGTHLPIDRLELTVPDRPGSGPLIRLDSSYIAGLVRIHAQLVGRLAQPSLNLTSDPPYPQEDLLSLIAFKRPPGALSQEQRQAWFIDQVWRVGEMLLTDRLPEVVPPSTARRHRILMQLGDEDSTQRSDVPFTLSQAVETGTNARLEYIWNPRWSLISRLDRENNPTVDVQYTQRFGGSNPEPDTEPAQQQFPAWLRGITLMGNQDISSDRLKSALANPPIGEGQWTAAHIQDAQWRLQQTYAALGYPEASCSAELQDQSKLTITIIEGTRLTLGRPYLHWVDTQGQPIAAPPDPDRPGKRLDEDDILGALAETFGIKQPFHEALVQAQAETLENVLLSRGFYGARVSVTAAAPRDGRRDVHFTLQPGALWTLAGWQCDPPLETLPGTARLIRRWNALLGTPLNPGSAEVLADDVRRALRQAGYQEQQVQARLDLDPGSRSAVAIIQVQPGALHTIGQVTLGGTERVNSALLQHIAGLNSGEVLSSRDISAAHRRLISTDLFRSVSITTTAQADQPEADEPPAKQAQDEHKSQTSASFPGKVSDLHVQFREREPYEWRFRVGYGALDHVRVGSDLWIYAPFGGVERVRFGAEVNARGQRIDASYVQPWFLDHEQLTLTVTPFWEHAKSSSPRFDEYLYGMVPAINHRWHRRFDTTYGMLIARISDVLEEDADNVFTPFIEANWDLRDDPLLPRRGGRFWLRYEASSTTLGSTISYSKLQTTASGYLKMGPLTLALSSEAGAIHTLDDTKLEDLPTSFRFTSGGVFSVRGFAEDSLGPKNAAGELVGGDALFALRSEVRFPLGGDWYGTVFYDLGNAWNDWDNFDRDILRDGAGAGIRWITPAGALIMDWGVNLDPEEGEDDWRFHLAFGMPF